MDGQRVKALRLDEVAQQAEEAGRAEIAEAATVAATRNMQHPPHIHEWHALKNMHNKEETNLEEVGVTEDILPRPFQ
ncbi:hypothetical protein HAX54_018670, partial [Datura stramonium]|nr:hypothetical protein [Datura stramonium]